jgi:hypothetical protein
MSDFFAEDVSAPATDLSNRHASVVSAAQSANSGIAGTLSAQQTSHQAAAAAVEEMARAGGPAHAYAPPATFPDYPLPGQTAGNMSLFHANRHPGPHGPGDYRTQMQNNNYLYSSQGAGGGPGSSPGSNGQSILDLAGFNCVPNQSALDACNRVTASSVPMYPWMAIVGKCI